MVHVCFKPGFAHPAVVKGTPPTEESPTTGTAWTPRNLISFVGIGSLLLAIAGRSLTHLARFARCGRSVVQKQRLVR